VWLRGRKVLAECTVLKLMAARLRFACWLAGFLQSVTSFSPLRFFRSNSSPVLLEPQDRAYLKPPAARPPPLSVLIAVVYSWLTYPPRKAS